MGWFDEQIRQRMENDDEMFSDAMAHMADIVMGKKLGEAMGRNPAQSETALEEIQKYYHLKPREIPDTVTDPDEQLELILRPRGMMRRNVILEGQWYRDAAGAMLTTRRDNGQPAALIPGRFSGYYFQDQGKWVRVTKKTAKLLDTEAIAFYRPFPEGKIGLRELCRYMLECVSGFDFLPVLLAALAVSLAGLLIPRLNHILYGMVIPGKSTSLFLAAGGFLICAALAQILLNTARTLASARIRQKIRYQVEAAAMMRLLDLPAQFFKKQSAGDLTRRLESVGNIADTLQSFFLGSGLSALFSLLYLGQMVRYGRALVWPGLILILCSTAFSVLLSILSIRVSGKVMGIAAREVGMNYDLFSGIQKIKLAGAEKRAFTRWADLYSQSLPDRFNPPFLLKFGGMFATGISLLGTMILYYSGIRSGISVQNYFAFHAAFGVVAGSFASLLSTATSAAMLRPMMDMVRPLLEAQTETSRNKKMVSRLSGSIELSHVSFRYTPEMPWVLDDISLQIKPGEYVAVVGATGCGKSTLLRLLLGFESAQKGSIFFDGQDIQALDLKSLRRHMGTVMQDGKLMQGDVFSNITIAAPGLTMEDAWEAARLSGIDQDIARMPMGMHTILAEGSGGISGGQKQRLLIARAVAPRPKILLMDEATSALDNLTQKLVAESLGALRSTRIVVAHRLSTIQACSRILVLSQGKIAEDGTYEELLSKNGLFAELVRRQQVDL